MAKKAVRGRTPPGVVSERPVVRQLRSRCLAFPETIETASWGHPNFRAGRKTFCTFEVVDGRPSIAFRVSPADADLLLNRPRFFATPYGRGQWVSVWADTPLNWRSIGTMLDRSYRLVANKRMTTALER